MSKELVISANRHETKAGDSRGRPARRGFFPARQRVFARRQHSQRTCDARFAGHAVGFRRLGSGTRHVSVCLGLFEEDEDFDRVSVTANRPAVNNRREPRAAAAARRRSNACSEVSQPALVEAEPASSRQQPRLRRRARRRDRRPTEPIVRTAAKKATGDGRGRRSRRRRNRGRGFPDSKYASEVPRPPRLPEPAAAGESIPAPVRRT